MFPSLRFNHEYWEPGVLIYGHDIYENGVKFSFIPSCDEEEEALCLYREDGCFFLDEYKDAVESYDAETVNNAIELFRKYNLISDREIPSMCPLAPAATA